MNLKIYFWEQADVLVMVHSSGKIEIGCSVSWFDTTLPKFTRVLTKYMELIYEG